MRFIPIALAVLWGLNWPAVKIILAAVSPWTLRIAALGIAALLLFLLGLVQGRRLTLAPAMWGRVAIAGFLNVGVFTVATAFAQLSTSTSRAAVLTFTMPMWSALFARIALGERLDRTKSAALFGGVIGLGFLAAPVIFGDGSKKGLILPLIAGMGWAAGTVFLKLRPIRGDRQTVTAWQMLIGGSLSLLGLILVGGGEPQQPMTIEIVAALVYHIVFATALAYVLWFRLLDHASATTAALTSLLIPVVGVLGAMVLVGDRPSAMDGVGFAAILIASGVILFNFSSELKPETVANGADFRKPQ
jgi:drug/metabolite transporter (DMT)-like permease